MCSVADPQTKVSLGQLPGVWRRDLYQAGDYRDAESLVFWIQAIELYGDLRDEPPGRIAFSGTLSQSRDVFTWDMPLTSFGEREFPDAGRLEWHGPDLIETGVHQEYTEIWRRVGTVSADDYAIRLENDDGQIGFVLQVSGFRFAMFGKPGDAVPNAALRGKCPRFGQFERRIGESGALSPLFDQTNQQSVPHGWRLSRMETNLHQGGVV